MANKTLIEVNYVKGHGYDVSLDGRLTWIGLSEAGLRDVYMQLFEAAKEETK